MTNRILLALAVMLALAAPAAADPIEGTWQTERDGGSYAHVEIAPCGHAYCGVLVRTFNETGEYHAPGLGQQIVRDMVPQGGGRYEGRVWRPTNDKVYSGRITVEGDRMALRGCIVGGLICASQTWVRID